MDLRYEYESLAELTEVPGMGMEVLQNLQKFRVWVWKSYRTHRSCGYGMEVLLNSQKFRVRHTNVLPRVLCHGRTDLTQVLGTGINVVQYLQKFRVRVSKSYRSHRSCGYGMEVLQNSQKFRVRYTNVVPVPRVLCHWRTELTEVPGRRMNVVHNSQKFRVRTGMGVVENSQKFRLRVIPG